MSKEAHGGSTCPGCNRQFAFLFNHIPHCSKVTQWMRDKLLSSRGNND